MFDFDNLDCLPMPCQEEMPFAVPCPFPVVINRSVPCPVPVPHPCPFPVGIPQAVPVECPIGIPVPQPVPVPVPVPQPVLMRQRVVIAPQVIRFPMPLRICPCPNGF